MQDIWILLIAVHIPYFCAAISKTNTYHQELIHGQQFSISLPTGAKKLEFISADESQKDVLWTKSSITKRGIVTGRDNNRRFSILSVTFDDQGTYTLLDFWDKKTSIHLLKVNTKRSTQNCVAGETLSISLGGLSKNNATLHFSSQDYNLTLVERGSTVGNSYPNYMGRIKLTGSSIQVLSVNVFDAGNYTLKDRLNRKVSIISMNLADSRAPIIKTKTYHDELMYGQQLSISLPTGAKKLEFISLDESRKDVLWSRFSLTKRGIVTGRDDNRKFAILSVTFNDQGTYTLLDFWDRKTSIHLLKVITKTGIQNCVAGETLSISLGGLLKNEATLHFSSQDYNLTLVERGSTVGNSYPDYMGRIKLTGNSIEVLNVNVSDVGNYTLSDHLNRKVKVLFMNLVDHHKGLIATPYVGLLLLLAIPPCIFFYSRKKICKKSSRPTTTTINDTITNNQINPPGHLAYANPAALAVPTMGYTPGYPAVGESIVHPPPNPVFPPQPPYSGYPATSPAMPPNPAFNPGYPPASGFPLNQPYQWSGAPYNRPASAGFAPGMYDATADPEPFEGEIILKTPLITPPRA